MATTASPASNGFLGPMLKLSLAAVEKQNEIKTKLKRTFGRLDEGKQGLIKASAFFHILEALDVSLSVMDK
jgi:Ca2+-binding EF-hand superfamily protein